MTPMEKENHRFNTLTPTQLRSRLNRITTEPKLVNFARVATERGLNDLAMAAESKLHELYGHTLNRIEPLSSELGRRLGNVIRGTATRVNVEDMSDTFSDGWIIGNSKDEEISELKKRIAELEEAKLPKVKMIKGRPKRLIDI